MGSHLLAVLTTANLVLLGYQAVAASHSASPPGVLRGRGLEIVDDRGRVRASITLHAEDPKIIWQGKPYPETVVFRLITADGRPNVKLGASRNGSALVMGGEADPTYVQLLAERGETRVTIKNKDGRERVLRP